MTELTIAPNPQRPPEPRNAATADLINGLTELMAAQPDYAKASAYYAGNQPEFFASMRLRLVLGAMGVTFNFNFSKLPVDAVAERLEIAGMSITDKGSLTLIQAEWEANQLDLFAPDVMLNACKFGDAYIFIWPRMPDETIDSLTPTDEASTVDMFYVSPRIMRVIYDDENEHQKKYAIKRWIDQTTDYLFVNLYYPDRIEKYMQSPAETAAARQIWEKRIDDGDDGWPVDNPYGQIPVFHFRNSFPYGVPEHKDAYGPQDAIHKLVISHMASVDYNAFPQRYAIMDERYDTSEAALGDEGEYSFSLATGATTGPLTDPQSQLSADPASVWFMKGVKSYGQFNPADPTSFLKPFSDYVHGMAVVTTTPMHFLDPIVSNVSGESLRVIEAPFAKKVRKRQISFGATWRDVWRFVLILHGQEQPAPIQVNWVPAATVSDLNTLQGQLIKAQLGVPPRQLLLEQGYTPEQLDGWGVESGSVPEQYMPTAGFGGGAAKPVPAPTGNGSMQKSSSDSGPSTQ